MQWMQASDFCFAMAVLALLLLLAATAAGRLVVARFCKFFFTSSRSDNQQSRSCLYLYACSAKLSRSRTHWVQRVIVCLSLSLSADSQYVCYHSPSCGDGGQRPVFVLGETVEDCCGQPNVRSARREIGASDNCSSCGECGVCLLCTEFFVSVQR